MRKYISIWFFIISVCFSAQQNLLQSGPMLGYCEMTEVKIWVQTKSEASVKIQYAAIENTKELGFSKEVKTNSESGYTAHIVLENLKPNQKYVYQVFINNIPVSTVYETSFTTKKLWQWRTQAPDFSVALGSCAYINETEFDRPGTPYGGQYQIFEKINEKKPDIMLWTGDNIYLREADWDSKSGIYHRYTHARSTKEMQPLLARTQNFAIWDDHDFGPNDSDRSYYLKHITQQAFKDFWGNKSYGKGKEQSEGIYSVFNWGDAEFFLLDNRFFRSPNHRKTGERTILGKEQLEWFIDALSSSQASFKIVVIGGQFINSAKKFENYSNYEEEKNEILKQLEINNIKGVVFLSGDRHFSELSQLKRPNQYPIYDWTVSPLTSGSATETAKKEENLHRVEGSMFTQHSFGIINFSGNAENRQMKLTLFDKDGKELWNYVILKKDLQ